MTSTTTTRTRYAVSADGTRIAYETTGSGPAVVFVDGAMCYREMGPSRAVAQELADRFTVYTYDRRGRGESDPEATEDAARREVEDLAAVIEAAGGHAHLVGVSSGAALALEAARAGLPVGRIALYEAPFILDDTHRPNDADLHEQLRTLVDDGRRGDAVTTFMKVVGVPAPFILLMRVLPAWRKLTGIAHTLPHDLSIVVPFQQGRPIPDGYYAGVRQPVLAIAGGKSPAYMRNAQAAVATAVPDGRVETLPGQTHMVKAKVMAPVVAAHLAS